LRYRTMKLGTSYIKLCTLKFLSDIIRSLLRFNQ
jgi:hypothetical protein